MSAVVRRNHLGRCAERLARDTWGQELVEFALASVVFFMIIFGTIEFGLGVWTYNMMSDLAQEGARWAAVRSTVSSADVQTFVQSRALNANVCSAAPTATIDTAPTRAAGTLFTVQVQCTFNPATTLIPSAALTLSASATMVTQR